MWRHILPNSMTPVVTFLPFRMSAAILALTSLDFLGLGVPPGTPSLGELLSQGKNNLDAWWISLSTFAVLVVTLLLLTFIGDALRDALDPRKVLDGDERASCSKSRTCSVAFGAASRGRTASPSRIDAGEKLALVGESGSGKTVTALSHAAPDRRTPRLGGAHPLRRRSDVLRDAASASCAACAAATSR